MTHTQSDQSLRAALALHQSGRFDAAAKLYAMIRARAPSNFDAAHLAGTLELQRGRMAEAAKTLAEARRLNPRSSMGAMRHGIALNALFRYPEAEAAIHQAIALDPGSADAWLHMGRTLRGLGRLDESIAAYGKSLAARPDFAEAHDQLGALLANARGHAAAEPHLRRATEIEPKRAMAWCNLGLCLTYLGRIGEAMDAFGNSLRFDPTLAQAHAGMGFALSRCYRHGAAVEAYGRAIAIDSRHYQARSARLYELQFDGSAASAEIFAEHRRFGAEASAEALSRSAALPAGRVSGGGRAAGLIRVGILSPDLHRHSVAYFLEPLLEGLDRSQCEVFLYHDQPVSDSMSARLRSLATQWKVTAGLSDDVVEASIRADAPDVLFDLAGHTGVNRLNLFARRLAPAQATYLGYPDTTGLDEMDFRLVDAITAPPGQADAFATERLLRFAPTAWCYAPPASAPVVGPGPAERGEPLTFGCFNSPAKITDESLRLWARILEKTPGSRLLLKGQGLSVEAIRSGFLHRASQAGIAPSRLALVERTKTIEEHLALYAQVDIALDTYPYHGTTTTCEALWMGVPVISQCGDRHASRVGASLLHAVGRPEWVAANADDTVARAVDFGSDRPGLVATRKNLRDAMANSVLCDRPGQAARFAAAIREMAAAKGIS